MQKNSEKVFTDDGGSVMVVYFGKINLCSNQIYDVIDKKSTLSCVLNDLEKSFLDNTVYEEEKYVKVDGTDTFETTKYIMHITAKEDSIFEGYIYKDAIIHYKVYNEREKKFDWKQVVSNESVNFYFDVQAELVGYLTANRFGYSEFLRVFQGVINQGLENEKSNYRFTVDQYSEGLDIDDIRNELKQLGDIHTLKFKYQPPNGMDEEMERLEEEADTLLNRYKNANLSTKCVTLTSVGPLGINLNSQEVEELLNETCINKSVDTKDATRYGYALVEATDNYGNKFTTAEKKPVKREISNIIEFSDACRKVIRKRNVDKNE